jgi:hypothetical protein
MKHRKLLAVTGALGLVATLAIPRSFAGTPPAISSIKVTATSVNVAKPPAALPLSVTFTAPLGLQTILVWGSSQVLNTAAEAQVAVMYYSTANIHPRSGTLSLEVPFAYNAYMKGGRWEITSAQICDVRTNCAYYDGSILANIVQNPKFTVINRTGYADNTPVTVSGGKILTPTVNLSKHIAFKYRLTAAQNVQGVQHLTINYTPPGLGYSLYSQSDLPSPVKSGIFVGGIHLKADSPLGKYTITGVAACPVVFQNPCAGAYTPVAIRRLLGATTFTVTK